MAFDTPVIFFLALAVAIGVPLVILIALDRLGMFNIFGSKTNKSVEERRRNKEEKAGQTSSQ